MIDNLLNYQGKNVLVVGGATGMGAAAAQLAGQLGANLFVMDVADISYPVAQAIKLDLRDAAAIDKAVAQLPATIDKVFCCAGVADGFPGIMLINFTGQRHLLDQLMASNRLGRGSAIVAISSVAGLPWVLNRAQVMDFLNCRDWDSAVQWIASHDDTDNYSFSKQAWNGYVAREGVSYLRQG